MDLHSVAYRFSAGGVQDPAKGGLQITAGAPGPAAPGRLSRELAASHYAAIIESSDDAILSKDLNGVIMTWNRGAELLFGYTAEEAVGKSVTSLLIPTDRHDEETFILDRIRRGEKVDHYETVRQRKDGLLINISLTVSPIRNEKGEIVGASKIARDITGSRRAKERQELLLREMDHRVKNLFALSISVLHLSGRSANSAREVTEVASARLDALARAHALTLSHGPSDRLQAAKPTTLHSLVEAIAAPYRQHEEDAGHRFSITGCDIEISGPTISSLALLLHEFATNSAKYGALAAPAGEIRVHCANEARSVVITWSEHGGPPVASPTGNEGFGDLLIRSTVVTQLGGELMRDWRPEGLVIRLSVPRERLSG